MKFKLESDYKPSGDQPEAIDQLCSALSEGVGDITLLGVTGSGKTFTMANVIERLQRPALILSHNKTLAAQLYGEFKSFFPANAVEYFVSYYDYYQPEAYIPSSDTYIEKDLSINDQIEKLRLSAASALLSGRRDVVVISSVSCLYGIGNPDDFHEQTVIVRRGERRSLTGLLYKLVDALYNRRVLRRRGRRAQRHRPGDRRTCRGHRRNQHLSGQQLRDHQGTQHSRGLAHTGRPRQADGVLRGLRQGA